MAEELRLEAGVVLAGRYRLDAAIGAGAMGQVWRGADLGLSRPVAVKLLPPVLARDADGATRFRREAEAAAALQHPGITAIYDIDTDGSAMFLVMELLQGMDLRALIAANPGGLPIGQAVSLADQIADALAAAHARGVVHRDIKPANLFLQQDGRVKICDFGIARLADRTQLTATGGLLGTPLYMAPEQFRGEPADYRADLYAFGGVLHELLTGVPPFEPDAPGLASLMYKHLNEPPTPLRQRRPDIPVHLENLVLAMLAKSPDQRPASAAAVRHYLQRQESPLAATLPAPSIPVRTQKKSRRPILIAGAAVATVAILGAGGFAVLQRGGSAKKPKATTHPSSTVIPTLEPVAGHFPGEAKPGAIVHIGQQAIVLVSQANTDAVGITVTSIVKGSLSDFPGGRLKDFDKWTPYYIHFTVTNLGPDDPNLDLDPTITVNGRNQYGTSQSNPYTHPGPCPGGRIPIGAFHHAARFDECAVSMAAPGADVSVVAAEWDEAPYGYDHPVVWN